MPHNTNTFMFHVSHHYIQGVSVTQPFYIEVEYSYLRDRVIDVLNIKMSIKLLGRLPLNDALSAEIKQAANQYHDKFFNDRDDISDALSGMPVTKSTDVQ